MEINSILQLYESSLKVIYLMFAFDLCSGIVRQRRSLAGKIVSPVFMLYFTAGNDH